MSGFSAPGRLGSVVSCYPRVQRGGACDALTGQPQGLRARRFRPRQYWCWTHSHPIPSPPPPQKKPTWVFLPVHPHASLPASLPACLPACLTTDWLTVDSSVLALSSRCLAGGNRILPTHSVVVPFFCALRTNQCSHSGSHVAFPCCSKVTAQCRASRHIGHTEQVNLPTRTQPEPAIGALWAPKRVNQPGLQSANVVNGEPCTAICH